jgi:antitoxin component YwqK of YwqJK toxin-antitoxin module
MKKYMFKVVLSGIPVIFIMCALVALSSCSQKKNNRTDLIKINGLLYKSGSNVPYTGREKVALKGRIIEYDVVNGVKQGEMKISYSEGKPQISGQMANNKNEGHWKYFYENSQVESEGDFKNDMPQGLWVWYFQNGKVREKGNYVSGKRDGKWLTYEESGKIAVVKKFKGGELIKK